MASSPLLPGVSLLLLLLLQLSSVAEPRAVLPSDAVHPFQAADGQEQGGSSVVNPTIDCAGACRYRCSASSRVNLCRRACGTCCARCNCVPPGTYGNTSVCPCYAALTTHGGRLKCP